MTLGASEVDGAIAEQLPELLATAMALTGEPAAAADLVGEVLVLARRPRSGVDLVDPGPGLRNLLVARYGTHRPAPVPAPAAVASPAVEPDRMTESDPPEGPDEPAEPDEVASVIAGLHRLTRPQRAALLLSFRDRLTYAEIAGIVDRPVGKVARSVADAQTLLDATPYAITAALERLGQTAPEPGEARAAGVRFSRRLGRRRRRVSVLVGVAVVVIALAVALPTVILPRLYPIPVRVAGEWAYGYQIAAPAGFEVSERFLERDKDSTFLVNGVEDPTGCTIEAFVASSKPQPSPVGSAVKVNGRPGWIYQNEDTEERTLTWLYAPQAMATVSCGDGPDPDQLLQQVAGGLTFTLVPLTLPYRLTALPEGYEVAAVGTSSELSPGRPEPSSALLLTRMGAAEDSENGGIFLGMPAQRPEGDQVDIVQVNGTGAYLEVQDGVITLCLPEQGLVACLSASSETAAAGSAAPDPEVRQLVDLASALQFPPNLGDRTTWFDARAALPR